MGSTAAVRFLDAAEERENDVQGHMEQQTGRVNINMWIVSRRMLCLSSEVSILCCSNGH